MTRTRHHAVMPATIIALLTMGVFDAAGAQQMGTEYRIFFPSGQTNLTDEDLSVATEIAAYANAIHATEIDIVGHADTSEANPDSLSELRARAVAAALQNDNAPPSARMSIVGVGIRYLGVPTAPGVAEPVNRFVTVDVR